MKTIWLWLCVCAVLLGGCARSAPPLDSFIEACSKGEADKVQAMLKQNPELAKASRPDGYTALHEAIMQQRDGLVPILLEAGANPNQVKGNGNQPLHAGVHLLKPETIALLIEKGATADGRAPNGDTPLIIAAGIGKVETARVLLEHKADPNLQNTETGAFPLYHAAASGNAELAKLLLDKGAKVTVTLNDGSTALHAAVEQKTQPMVKQLLAAKADPNALDQRSRTPLTIAVATGQLSMLDVLLEGGADPKVGNTMHEAQGKKDIQAHLKAVRPKVPKGAK